MTFTIPGAIGKTRRHEKGKDCLRFRSSRSQLPKDCPTDSTQTMQHCLAFTEVIAVRAFVACY